MGRKLQNLQKPNRLTLQTNIYRFERTGQEELEKGSNSQVLHPTKSIRQLKKQSDFFFPSQTMR